MKRKKLTVLAIILGSSLAVVAGCYTYGSLNCPPYVNYGGVRCNLAGDTTYASAVGATDPHSSDNYDNYYSDNGQHCLYVCFINNQEQYHSFFPAGLLTGNPCTPGGSGSGTGGGTGGSGT